MRCEMAVRGDHDESLGPRERLRRKHRTSIRIRRCRALPNLGSMLFAMDERRPAREKDTRRIDAEERITHRFAESEVRFA
jgi:hypothetical protein